MEPIENQNYIISPGVLFPEIFSFWTKGGSSERNESQLFSKLETVSTVPLYRLQF